MTAFCEIESYAIKRVCFCIEQTKHCYTALDLCYVIVSSPFKRQPDKMVKYTQTICRQHPTNCLSVLDHFVGLALKGLSNLAMVRIFQNKEIWNPSLLLTSRTIHEFFSRQLVNLRFFPAGTSYVIAKILKVANTMLIERYWLNPTNCLSMFYHFAMSFWCFYCLTLNIFYTFFYCFYYWFWKSKW